MLTRSTTITAMTKEQKPKKKRATIKKPPEFLKYNHTIRATKSVWLKAIKQATSTGKSIGEHISQLIEDEETRREAAKTRKDL